MVTSDGKMVTEVMVETRDGSKYVALRQQLYLNKVRKLSWCYSIEFSDLEIVADLNKSSKFPDEFFVLSSSSTVEK